VEGGGRKPGGGWGAEWGEKVVGKYEPRRSDLRKSCSYRVKTTRRRHCYGGRVRIEKKGSRSLLRLGGGEGGGVGGVWEGGGVQSGKEKKITGSRYRRPWGGKNRLIE